MYTLKPGGGNNLTIMYLPDNKQVIVASYQEIGIGDDCQFKQIVVLGITASAWNVFHAEA